MPFLECSVNLTGKPEVKAVMEALRRATRETMKEAADVVALRAKPRAPKVSGLLRSSIKGKVRKMNNSDQYGSTVSTNTRNKTVSYYKRYQLKYGEHAGEYRMKKVTKTSKYGYGFDVEVGRAGEKYKSTPYLRPALLESVGTIQGILKREADHEAVTR